MDEDTTLVTITASMYRKLMKERDAGMRAWAHLTVARDATRNNADYREQANWALDVLDVVFK